MKNAVRWYKATDDVTAVVQVFEDGRWVNAQRSRIHTPDVNFKGVYGSASVGFATYQKALKLGYENKGLFVADAIKQD